MSRSKVLFALRALLSCALVGLLLGRVRWPEFVAILRGVHPATLIAGALLSPVLLILLAVRVRLLLRQGGICLQFPTVLALTWKGQFFNAFLPGSTGGDVVKAYEVCRLAPGAKAAAIAALVTDRLVALAALLLLAAAALALDPAVVWELVTNNGGARFFAALRLPVSSTTAILVLGMGILLAAAASWAALRRAHARIGRVGEHLRNLLSALRGGLRPSRALFLALLLALSVHLLNVLSAFLFARALQVPVSYLQILLLWPVVMVATLLPVTVNGHGLRECLLLFYFTQWHLGSAAGSINGVSETIVALSLLTVVNELCWNLPGAFWRLHRKDGAAAENATTAPIAAPRGGSTESAMVGV